MTAVALVVTLELATAVEPHRMTVACYGCGETIVESLVYAYGSLGAIVIDHATTCAAVRAAKERAA